MVRELGQERRKKDCWGEKVQYDLREAECVPSRECHRPCLWVATFFVVVAIVVGGGWGVCVRVRVRVCVRVHMHECVQHQASSSVAPPHFLPPPEDSIFH